MAESGAAKKAHDARKAKYAPKLSNRSLAKPLHAEKHRVPDEIPRKIIQRVPEQLKELGKAPSEVILMVLMVVRELVERTAAAAMLGRRR